MCFLGKTQTESELENARCNLSPARILKIYSGYGYSAEEFEQIKLDPKKYIAEFSDDGKKDQTITQKPRCNHFKIVTKEVRVLRILRIRKKLTQYEASRLCGYIPGGFEHIEVGTFSNQNFSKIRRIHCVRSIGKTDIHFCARSIRAHAFAC